MTELGEITPLPTPAELGCVQIGASNLVEVTPHPCACGVEIGLKSYAISSRALSGESFNDVCTSLGLNGCCRMRILAPFIMNVVSIDVAAKFTDDWGSEDIQGPI